MRRFGGNVAALVGAAVPAAGLVAFGSIDPVEPDLDRAPHRPSPSTTDAGPSRPSAMALDAIAMTVSGCQTVEYSRSVVGRWCNRLHQPSADPGRGNFKRPLPRGPVLLRLVISNLIGTSPGGMRQCALGRKVSLFPTLRPQNRLDPCYGFRMESA